MFPIFEPDGQRLHQQTGVQHDVEGSAGHLAHHQQWFLLLPPQEHRQIGIAILVEITPGPAAKKHGSGDIILRGDLFQEYPRRAFCNRIDWVEHGHGVKVSWRRRWLGHDLRAANAATLQQPGAPVARHKIIGVSRQGHRQQEGVVWVIRLNSRWQRRQYVQHNGPPHAVDHRADAMGRQDGLELWVAAHTPQFVELRI